MSSVVDMAKVYKDKGFRPIPLIKNGKNPVAKWGVLEHLEFRDSNNVGLVAGSQNGLIFADLDDERSLEVVPAKLQEMGLWDKLTTVRTPKKGGLHVWLKCHDVPDDVKTYYHYRPEIGKGEIRLRYKAYCVAPGSVLPEGAYRFEQGGLYQFINQQPDVNWNDLLWLLPDKYEKAIKSPSKERDITTAIPLSLPVRRIFRDNPKDALRLASMLQYASTSDFIPWKDHIPYKLPDGITLRGYANTSDAEGALVVMLILAGWNFDQVKIFFDSIASPHYREAKEGYLLRTYNSAILMLAKDQPRRQIAEAYQYASSIPWPGRTGGYDLKVLLAILSKAWQFNTLYPMVSYREISEHAGIRVQTAHKTVKRLQTEGFLRKLYNKDSDATQAYDVGVFVSVNNRNISPKTPHL